MSPTPEMRSWRRRTIAWCFLMCLAFALVVASGTYYYVQRTSDRLEANRQRADQQSAKNRLLADRKFQQSIRISTTQSAYSINRSVCTLRPFLVAARKARLAAVKASLDAKDRRLNEQAAKTYKQLIDAQVTAPSDFACASLPKTPPKPKQHA